MKPSVDLIKLVEYGIRAPSGHNTQPWLFSIKQKEGEILIHPDFSRSLPVVDGDNHALYISLGCAAENIVIAAAEHGLRSDASLSKREGEYAVRVSLTPDDTVGKDELFNYILDRQSTRNEYGEKKVPPQDLDALKHSFGFEGIDMLTFTASDEIKALEPFIIEGSNAQFQNEQFVEELLQWIRFSDKKAKEKADGLWSKCMGLPGVPRFIGTLVMRYFMSAKSEAKRWRKLLQATAGLALFTVSEDDVEHWVRLGRAFQRFGLTATKLGISHAHMNMPCEEPEVREKLRAFLELGSKDPLLLIRFGYSEKMPYSLRRSPEEVIVSSE